MGAIPVKRRALLSVTDRAQLCDLAALLDSYDVELLASGGTAAHLRDHGFAVTDVSEATGFPEVFAGRVKTLHPLIHGGLLGPSASAFDDPQILALGLKPIDILVVNLYPFAAALAGGAGPQELIERIDIGGPALLRAAAKNHERVTVLSSPSQYEEFLHEYRAGNGQTSLEFRCRCAQAAFDLVAVYDRAIADWMHDRDGFQAADPDRDQPHAQANGTAPCGTTTDPAAGDPSPQTIVSLRYGENPHQSAWCTLPSHLDGGLTGIGLRLHGGKALSYNNLADTVAALKLLLDLPEPGCAIIKHTNPCGLGLGAAPLALERALLCDPVSAYGGVVALNQAIDRHVAAALRGRFLEIVAATGYTDDSLQLLLKRKNLRVLTWDPAVFQAATRGRARSWGELTLFQDEDEGFPECNDWTIAAGETPDGAVRRDLELAWAAAKHGKSNAIVLVRGGATLGCGFGQMSRVDAVRLAVRKAQQEGLDGQDCVAASDGFFPFADGIEELARAGARWILAPGGSVRDGEVAACARSLGITLIFASRRHFNH